VGILGIQICHSFVRCKTCKTWLCTCDRLCDCSMSHSKQCRAKTTSVHTPVVTCGAIECWTEGWGIKSQYMYHLLLWQKLSHTRVFYWQTGTSLAKSSISLISWLCMYEFSNSSETKSLKPSVFIYKLFTKYVCMCCTFV
jgi:hypothetical protein